MTTYCPTCSLELHAIIVITRIAVIMDTAIIAAVKHAPSPLRAPPPGPGRELSMQAVSGGLVTGVEAA